MRNGREIDAGTVLTRISSDKTNQQMSFMCHRSNGRDDEREKPKCEHQNEYTSNLIEGSKEESLSQAQRMQI